MIRAWRLYLLVAAVGVAVAACGGNREGASKSAPAWDRAGLGAAANELIAAVADRDVEKLCSLFPLDQDPSTPRKVCLDTMRSNRFCDQPCPPSDTDFLTTPTVGQRVVDALQSAPSAWSVVLAGPPNPRWTTENVDPSTPRAVQRGMERAAHRGYQCVYVLSARGRPLRAAPDPDCIGYVQLRLLVGRNPDVTVVR